MCFCDGLEFWPDNSSKPTPLRGVVLEQVLRSSTSQSQSALSGEVVEHNRRERCNMPHVSLLHDDALLFARVGTHRCGPLSSNVRPLSMTIEKHQAVDIARRFAANLPHVDYPIKPDFLSAELRDSDSFSRLLGVDCRHWAIAFEYAVPDDIVLSPDEILVLVAEPSGKATLATVM